MSNPTLESVIQFIQAGQVQRALTQCRLILVNGTEPDRALYWYGVVLQRLGHYEEALVSHALQARIDPGYGDNQQRLDLLRQNIRFDTHESLAFEGPFLNWSEAQAVSTGYADPKILQKTRASCLAVKEGKAAYERDSKLFNKIEHPHGLLAGLLRAAAEFDHRLTVLDFGGSLGSSYFQCREFLRPLKSIHWWVVEQSAHVACGQKEFAGPELHFAQTTDEVLSQTSVNVLLMSGVLNCLENPWTTLQSLSFLDIPYIILDRTFLHASDPLDYLTVQTVPPSTYEARLPFWLLSRETLTRHLNARYNILSEFIPHCDDPFIFDDKPIVPYGCIARSRSQQPADL